MINNIYIITLTLNHSGDLIKTLASAQELAKCNKLIKFKQIIVSPSDFDKLNELQAIAEESNFSVSVFKDDKNGIYNAFNIGLSAINDDGYAIFLSAGDVFKRGVKLNTSELNEGYAMIAYAVEIIKKNTSFIYKPKILRLPLNTIPHPGSLTKVSIIKSLGLFPTDLGTSADFYITNKILRMNMKILLKMEALADFSLGGASSTLSSIKDYVKSLERLGYNKLTIILCSIIKFMSYIKYAKR